MSQQLFHEIMDSNGAEVERLVSSGLDLLEVSGKENWSYLHQALLMPHRHPSPEMIKLLVNKGVNANLNDIYGNNALHYAVMTGELHIVEILIDAGADINHLNQEGLSPLRQVFSVTPINYSMVRLLVKNGANPDNRPEDGLSDLEFAKVIGPADVELKAILNY